MLDTIHIKLEKITGLKGSIEGAFHLLGPEPQTHLPLVYVGDCEITLERNEGGVVVSRSDKRIGFRFEQDEINLILICQEGSNNYKEHFESGVNFLIKEWNYGRGEAIKHTGHPN